MVPTFCLTAFFVLTVKNDPGTILLVGATGALGKVLLGQALQRGYRVRALARKPQKLKVEHPNLEVISGDVLQPDTLEVAATGVDLVISALGHKRFLFPGRILSRGTQNLLQVMKDQGVNRILAVTAMGISENRYRLGLYYTLFLQPLLLWPYFRDKERQEKILRNSELNYTIIRPANFIPGSAKSNYRHGERLGSYVLTPLVSRATVARFILDELQQCRYERTAVCVAH